MSATVRVTINDRTIEVPAGTLVTDAARLAEVHVPIFCSHAKLPPLGACRICLVEIGTPKLGPDRKPLLRPDGTPEIAWMPKPQTGCTTPVSDGMVVRSESPVAVKARQGIMEFLLVNHPLDCPVCDEGGECQLQDLAFAFGADLSRMSDAKRVFVSEDLGPIVKKEANRCIVCMRCVRYCDEIMGDDALTAHQRGVRTEISSFNRQPLECEQCGNCIEVCPVGALTALPYRFKARPWDLRQHVTICPWCSNGCSVRLGVRGAEILRARGTEHRGVNQEYLCVRGRFGYEFVSHADRLSSALLRSGGRLEPAGFDEAVTFAASRLREIAAAHGPDSIAFLGGEKLALEEQYLFQKLARGVLGTPHVDARTRLAGRVPAEALIRATGGGRPLISFEELGTAGEVLVLLEDLRGESPFAQAVLIRGQHQQGLHLTVAHPRRVKLARGKFGGDWLGLRPGSELALLNGLTRAALDHGDPADLAPDAAKALATLRSALPADAVERAARETGLPAAAIAGAAERLHEARSRAIVFGRGVLEHPQAAALLQAIENLGWATGAIAATRSSVLYLGPQNGSEGALAMGLAPDVLPGWTPVADAGACEALGRALGTSLPERAGLSAPEILAAAAEGRIRALWIASDHLLRSAADRTLAERALAACELVIVNELFLTDTARRAHVVFAACSFAEKEGTAMNAERRVQRMARALAPRRGTRTDLEIFQATARSVGAAWSYRGPEDVFREIARVVPGWRGTSWATLLPLGPCASRETPLAAAPALPREAPAAPAPATDGFALLTGGTLFLQGSLSHRTVQLPKLAGEARAFFHPDDARRLGLANGAARVALAASGATIELGVEPDASIPPGSVFVPYAFEAVELNRLGAAPRVTVTRVEVEEGVGA